MKDNKNNRDFQKPVKKSPQNFSESFDIKTEEIREQIIYGKNAVTEALLSGCEINSIYISKTSGGMGKIQALAKEHGVVIKEVAEEKLRAMTEPGAKHGGVAAVKAAASYSTIEEILKTSAEKGLPPFIVAADGIQDPHNLGAIIRTAEAAGADGVIITKRRSVSLTSTVYKTSAGAASWIKVARVNSLAQTLKELKTKGIWIYGAEADGTPFHKVKLDGGCCLVIGSEGCGLSRLVRDTCDQVLSIDMYGHVNSLNASVSAGILIYEAVKFRRNI